MSGTAKLNSGPFTHHFPILSDAKATEPDPDHHWVPSPCLLAFFIRDPEGTGRLAVFPTPKLYMEIR